MVLYIGNIENTLKVYEENRNKYRTIEDYYDKIIESFNIDPD